MKPNCKYCGAEMYSRNKTATGGEHWRCPNAECPNKRGKTGMSIASTNKAAPKTATPDDETGGSLFVTNTTTGVATLVYCSKGDAPTVPEAFAKFDQDPRDWEVLVSRLSSSQVTGRVGVSKDGEGGWKHEWGTFTNWHLSLTLRPRGVDSEKAVAGAIELLKKAAPGAPKKARGRPKAKTDPCMLEIGLVDHHFGMLSWDAETGVNYDLKIAEIWYARAIDELLRKSAFSDPEKIVMPLGHDFMHCNDPSYLTPQAKNRLDVEGRYCKIFEVAIASAVRAVDAALQVAPVKVVLVPGNHDPQTSYHLVKYLEAWYSNNKHVTVDAGPNPIKYIGYGVNLIGCMHGSETQPQRIPAMMFLHNSTNMSNYSRFECHCGHLHSRKSWKILGGMEEGGVTIRTLPSLASNDFWAHSKGFERTHRAAEAYIWSKKGGYYGHVAAEFPLSDEMI